MMTKIMIVIALCVSMRDAPLDASHCGEWAHREGAPYEIFGIRLQTQTGQTLTWCQPIASDIPHILNAAKHGPNNDWISHHWSSVGGALPSLIDRLTQEIRQRADAVRERLRHLTLNLSKTYVSTGDVWDAISSAVHSVLGGVQGQWSESPTDFSGSLATHYVLVELYRRGIISSSVLKLAIFQELHTKTGGQDGRLERECQNLDRYWRFLTCFQNSNPVLVIKPEYHRDSIQRSVENGENAWRIWQRMAQLSLMPSDVQLAIKQWIPSSSRQTERIHHRMAHEIRRLSAQPFAYENDGLRFVAPSFHPLGTVNVTLRDRHGGAMAYAWCFHSHHTQTQTQTHFDHSLGAQDLTYDMPYEHSDPSHSSQWSGHTKQGHKGRHQGCAKHHSWRHNKSEKSHRSHQQRRWKHRKRGNKKRYTKRHRWNVKRTWSEKN